MRRVQEMSSELDRVFTATAFGAVPSMWQSASYPAPKPVALHVAGLLASFNKFTNWCATPC